MAKSIRSKQKKKHRSYMRKQIGEKVRTKNIEACASRLADKKRGRGNTKTLSYVKGALGGAGLHERHCGLWCVLRLVERQRRRLQG